MARTAEERAALREELEREEQEEKEAARRGGGRSENIDVYIDLSDEAAVQRGLDLGFLKPSDVENGGDGDGDDGDGGKGGKEKPPARKGYFKDGE